VMYFMTTVQREGTQNVKSSIFPTLIDDIGKHRKAAKFSSKFS